MDRNIQLIKIIAFDLDGVLCDSRILHFECLNAALESVAGNKYIISKEKHLAKYDGLPTKKKLLKLTEEEGLDAALYDAIWKAKQEKTISTIDAVYKESIKLIDIFTELRKQGYKIAVASNSIREVVRLILHKLGILYLTDFYISNEDIIHPKPHPEMYMQTMLYFKVSPQETLVIEDSHVGRKAALDSGAHLLPVRNTKDVTLERIQTTLDKLQYNTIPKWQGGHMNVLIPCAGLGKRFKEAGYTFPKPLIEVVPGKTMIQMVIENLNIQARHIFIIQKEHNDQYNFKQMLNLLSPGCEVIEVENVTEGAACTALLAEQFINNDEPLLIANSDQYLVWNSNEFMYSMEADNTDGGLATFTATHPKWSFAKLDEHGYVSEVAEKNPISDIASTGIYWWNKGSDFVKYAHQMIAKNIRTNGEYYLAPSYNQAIEDGKKIKVYHIKEMYGTGTPEDLVSFQEEIKNGNIIL